MCPTLCPCPTLGGAVPMPPPLRFCHATDVCHATVELLRMTPLRRKVAATHLQPIRTPAYVLDADHSPCACACVRSSKYESTADCVIRYIKHGMRICLPLTGCDPDPIGSISSPSHAQCMYSHLPCIPCADACKCAHRHQHSWHMLPMGCDEEPFMSRTTW